MTTRTITGKAAARLKAFLDANDVKPLSAEELAEVRANPDIDDDLIVDEYIPRTKRGRPSKDEGSVTTIGKTVKQTPAFWAELEAKAKARGMTVHEAMREALAKWLAA